MPLVPRCWSAGRAACCWSVPRLHWGHLQTGDVHRHQRVCAEPGESLWAEWKDRGVDVLNLLIGTVDTPTMRDAMVKLNIPDALTMALPKAEDLARWRLSNWVMARR